MKLLTRMKAEIDKRTALRRVNNSRVGFQLVYELMLALFLLTVGLSIRGASSTEIAGNNNSPADQTKVVEFVVTIAKGHIEVQSDGIKKGTYPSIIAAVRDIEKIYSFAPKKSYKVILAPSADVFSEVPAWYRTMKSGLPGSVSVSVAIP